MPESTPDTLRDVLDPIYALPREIIEQVLIHLQCIVSHVETPDSIHELLDSEYEPLKVQLSDLIYLQNVDGTMTETTMEEYRASIEARSKYLSELWQKPMDSDRAKLG